MKNNGRKLAIRISVVVSIMLILAVGGAFVWASFQAISENKFEVSYIAGANVKATVKTEYAIVHFTDAHSGNNFIAINENPTNWQLAYAQHEFTGSETELTKTVTSTKNGINDAFTGTVTSSRDPKFDILLIRFTIKNNDTSNSINVKGTAEELANHNNMVVTRASDLAGTADSVFTTNGTSCAASGELVVYVQVRVQEYTSSATFHEKILFSLTAN